MTRFFLLCRFNGKDIASSMGKSEYSYWFVAQYFKKVLETMGEVVEIADDTEIPERPGDDEIVLSFAPPHQTPVNHLSQLTPVFAWEYGSLPAEPLGGDGAWDWPSIIRQCRGVLVHSEFTARQVSEVVPGLPVCSITVPIFERFQTVSSWMPGRNVQLVVDGIIWTREDGAGTSTWVGGVVYTYVFNPMDGRKRWEDLVSGFAAALRNEAEACLVMKLIHHDMEKAVGLVADYVSKLGKMKCRIVVLCGFLPADAYQSLMELTTYAVNTSCGEGQCLPLIEYMAAGRPGLAPRHTAMDDYVRVDNSFVIDHLPSFVPFPNDPEFKFRTWNYPVDWMSLVKELRRSFEVATNELEIYQSMSEQARVSIAAIASIETFRRKVDDFVSSLKSWETRRDIGT